MRLVFVLVVFASLASCGDSKKETKEDYVESIQEFEDSLKMANVNITDPKKGVQYAERCLEVAHKFPKSDEAPEYMDKAHMIFAGLGLHSRSANIADSIIKVYPRYKNRVMVLQSAATTYDMFLLPRKKEKVKEYYELILKENPKLPKEQREEIEFRLKNIDLTFEELIKLQSAKKPA